jgi:hypothetical protein
MALPLYLALTAGEFQNCSPLPEHTAWMACHYSPYGLGLSNSPRQLPEGAMLILNDRTPPLGHDPDIILHQLQDLEAAIHYKYILLDFQRPDSPENAAVAKALTSALSCHVGVSELYAQELECPVFLPPVPPHIPLREQREAVGHAVRAVYLYAGAADVAKYTGDAELFAACEAIMANIVNKRMYITGGIGSSFVGETFT